MDPVVLVVEDEPAVRLVITRSLVARGYAVESAVDGASAMRILAGQRIDLVVLDVNLPDQTGWDLARFIRQEIGPDLPIVVISAVTPRVARLREHGVAGVLQKPFPMESLLQLVARHTGQAPTPISRRGSRMTDIAMVVVIVGSFVVSGLMVVLSDPGRER